MPRKAALLTRRDRALWACSSIFILASFLLFGRGDYLTLAASLTGVSSLIFNAKAHPIGQVLMIVFSALYGLISLSCAYYGEMVTYLGMTAPMAAAALVSWLRHPFEGRQVAVHRVGPGEMLLMLALTALVTWGFYYILRAFGTANLAPSTLSVATSFLAAALTFRRSELFPLAYAANDAVLIFLWALASAEDSSYLPVLCCFVMFLINDLYGYASWRAMAKAQAAARIKE